MKMSCLGAHTTETTEYRRTRHLVYTSKVFCLYLYSEHSWSSSVFWEVIEITAMVWWRANTKTKLLYPLCGREQIHKHSQEGSWHYGTICWLIWQLDEEPAWAGLPCLTQRKKARFPLATTATKPPPCAVHLFFFFFPPEAKILTENMVETFEVCIV